MTGLTLFEEPLFYILFLFVLCGLTGIFIVFDIFLRWRKMPSHFSGPVVRRPWHHEELPALLVELAVDPVRGLASEEAGRRLRRDGRNELRNIRTVSPLTIFFRQFASLVIWVLIGAVGVSIYLGEKAEGIAIISIVALNAVIGFFQEFRAEKAAASLARLAAPKAKIVRNGRAQVCAAAEIVAGDILLLDAGDLVAADARLLEVSSLRANEVSLTGESQPVDKSIGILPVETPLADRSNMVFLGTSIAGGSARALVTAIGMRTELGLIAQLLETAEKDTTPLQKRLDRITRYLLWVCLGIVALVFLLGLLRSLAPFELFLSAVSLAVAAIPEGLPAVVTVALALGMQRMIRRNALVRRLQSVETLGCAQVICTDKTGTLTVGEMTARRLLAGGRFYEVTGEGYRVEGNFFWGDAQCVPSQDAALYALLYAAAACSDAELVGQGIIGDPTEGALLVAAAKGGIGRADIEASAPRLAALPFDSGRKRMTVVRREGDSAKAFTKGASEVVLARCAYIHDNREFRTLADEDRQAITQAVEEMARDALRVLAVAQRSVIDHGGTADEIERELIFLGLFGLQDPPRAEAKSAVARCRSAGIKPVMITGDHPDTAAAIARELGILGDDGGKLMTGRDLERMADTDFTDMVRDTAVYARVTAEDKLRIVRAWKADNKVVAMTGDGVNDAPALKEAAIGIAMGQTGTEVTKEAADLIIVDDDFSSIVAAVEEGRGIYENIAKTLAYLLAGNSAELMVMLIAALVGWPLPLLPLQLLWINLTTDGLPALALAADPVASDVLKRPPRPPDAELLDEEYVRLTLLAGILTAATSLSAFALEFYLYGEGLEYARDATFTALVIAELLRAFGARSSRKTVFEIGLLSNLWLFLVIILSFSLHLVIHQVPALQALFGTKPLSTDHFAVWMALGCIPLTALEVRKMLLRRRRRFK
ncbi:cation-translocating P-type ATPase [Methylomicrobium sp. RS1]|uniref:cation-translocating P-type ATPase n=1 Tax=Candidatus Methylomicrobium oryzae TaxID=2802053 RepID=UPI0030199E52